MEYCQSNLQTIKLLNQLNSGFSEKELLKILKDIAIALSDLHRNCIVHLDIKPGKHNEFIKKFIKIKFRKHTSNLQ